MLPPFQHPSEREEAALLNSCCLSAVSGEKAGWHKDDLPWLLIAEYAPDLPLVLRGRCADDVLKFRTKRSQAGIANFQAHFGDGHFSGSKQEAGALHASAGKEVMRGLAEGRVKQAMEVKWREASFASGGIEKDLRLVAGSQKIAGATEATKSFVVHERR
jgi:hypothetical protein